MDDVIITIYGNVFFILSLDSDIFYKDLYLKKIDLCFVYFYHCLYDVFDICLDNGIFGGLDYIHIIFNITFGSMHS